MKCTWDHESRTSKAQTRPTNTTGNRAPTWRSTWQCAETINVVGDGLCSVCGLWNVGVNAWPTFAVHFRGQDNLDCCVAMFCRWEGALTQKYAVRHYSLSGHQVGGNYSLCCCLTKPPSNATWLGAAKDGAAAWISCQEFMSYHTCQGATPMLSFSLSLFLGHSLLSAASRFLSCFLLSMLVHNVDMGYVIQNSECTGHLTKECHKKCLNGVTKEKWTLLFIHLDASRCCVRSNASLQFKQQKSRGRFSFIAYFQHFLWHSFIGHPVYHTAQNVYSQN